LKLLSNKELTALKAMAAGSLEAALMAAARFGATKSADAAKPIKRAAEMLDCDAECLKAAHTIGGKWRGDDEARQDYDERKKVAKALRGLIAA
jgi:hypothetical protein